MLSGGRKSLVVGRGARLKVDAEGGFGERVGGGICRELQPRTKEDQWEARAQISKPPRRGNNPRSSYRTHWRMAAHTLTRCVRCSVYMRNARTRFVLWPLWSLSGCYRWQLQPLVWRLVAVEDATLWRGDRSKQYEWLDARWGLRDTFNRHSRTGKCLS